MVRGKFNFDKDAYLQARPDVGRAGVDPYQHYLEYGKNEGMDKYNIFNQSIQRPDPALISTYDNEGNRTNKVNFFDPNEYSSVGRFVARNDDSGQYDFNKAAGDFRGLKFIGESGDEAGNIRAMYENEDGLGFTFNFANNEWEGNKYNYEGLQELKRVDPNQYYKKVGENYKDMYFNNWKYNQDSSYGARKLEELKDINPYSYYLNKIDAEAKKAGWQYGQNREDRAQENLNKIKELVPGAVQVGISPEELDKMINASMNAASIENQRFIQNRKGGGFNLGELVKGIAPIAAFAIGAPLLDKFLLAGTAASGGFGGLTGAATKTGAFGSLNAAIPAAGTTFGGLSSALPYGTIMGTGLNGGALGMSYIAAGPGQIAKNAFGAPILYSGAADTTQFAKNLYDAYKTSRTAQNATKTISDLLTKRSGSAPGSTVIGGGGGSNANIAAILNSNANLERGAARLRQNSKPFLTTAGEIVVDPDTVQRRTRKPKNFGLADILMDMENYG